MSRLNLTTQYPIMAKFLEGNSLNHALENILKEAEEYILLVSPFIQFHERYISVLKEKLENPRVKLVVVFGKNENDMSKSMKSEDFNFLKSLRNVEIRFERRLHAKYYANESAAILASMNLYTFSLNNNIEAGVLLTKPLLNVVSEDSAEIKSREYFKRVIDQSKLLFKASPFFESTLMGLSKRYISTQIETDLLSSFFENKKHESDSQHMAFKGLESKKERLPVEQKIGYCIRTGKEIPFNISKPLCNSAFESWSRYKDENYREKFCHFSGEPSNGQTSYKNPILSKNVKKAQENFKLG